MNENTVDGTELSLLDQKRAAIGVWREGNRRAAEAAAEARDLARLDEELAYEEARARLYADPKVGPDRVVGGELQGAGFCALVWPDPITWRHFQNKGILKKDGLSQELCDDLVCRCVRFPELPRFRQMLEANPSASVQLATAIINAMQPEDADLGKGLKNSLPRR